MKRETIRISEAEAEGNFRALMAQLRVGAEIIIEENSRPVATLRLIEDPPVRLLSESLRLARQHASTVTLDEGFGRDLEAIVDSHREPLDPPAWD
jgi:hypothetical protein